MNPSSQHNDQGPPRRGGGEHDALAAMLVRRLTNSFGIPAPDAEAIVVNARLCLLAAGGATDAEAWLVETVCEAARGYWRRTAPADASAGETETLREVIFTGRALEALPPQMREALRLRCHEGRAYEDIAQEMDIARPYAERLVARALAKMTRARRK